VDAPYAGRRERDLRTGSGPAEIRPAIEATASSSSLTVAEVFGLSIPRSPGRTWSDSAASSTCRSSSGLITGEDAALAVEHGAAGVVVSNHGGRQLDNVPATIDASRWLASPAVPV
jgi:hypothetical protein